MAAIKTTDKSCNRQVEQQTVDCKLKASPFGQLLDAVRKEYATKGVWTEDLQHDLPKKWEKHGNLVLLPENCFTLSDWRTLGPELWSVVAHSLKCNRLGRKKRIRNDDHRSPHVELLFGPDGWVEHIDNGIKYNYDVTKCMFSIGNITEKLRIAAFDCRGETVVDLFAGIGYFTLPYLVRAKASHVFACEWNPDAVEALKRNLLVNKVQESCTILEGDCRKVCPSEVADRVNLGLLPTASPYWLTACRALKPTGGYLHIHENITLSKLQKSATVDSSQPNRMTENGDSAFMNTHLDHPDALKSLRHKQLSLDPVLENAENVNDLNKLNNDAIIENGDEKRQRRKLSQVILQEIEHFDAINFEPTVDEHFVDEWNKLDKSYTKFSKSAAQKVFKYLNNLRDQKYKVRIDRIGKIKSYAPQIDHVVLDLFCCVEN